MGHFYSFDNSFQIHLFTHSTGGVQEKTSYWLFRFLGCSIFSRGPRVSHLDSILQSLDARQLSMFLLSHPTCSCPLASKSSFGILSSLKSLPVSAKKFRLFRQFAKHLLGLLRDKSPRSPMWLLLHIIPELQHYTDMFFMTGSLVMIFFLLCFWYSQVSYNVYFMTFIIRKELFFSYCSPTLPLYISWGHLSILKSTVIPTFYHFKS